MIEYLEDYEHLVLLKRKMKKASNTLKTGQQKGVKYLKEHLNELIGMFHNKELNKKYRRVTLLQNLARNLKIHKRVLKVIHLEYLQQEAIDYLCLFARDN